MRLANLPEIADPEAQRPGEAQFSPARWWHERVMPCLRSECSQPVVVLIAVYLVTLIVFATSSSMPGALAVVLIMLALIAFVMLRIVLIYRTFRAQAAAEAAAAARVRRRTVLLPQRLPPGVSIAHLRLMLADRDFTGEDYDMLLALDAGSIPVRRQATEIELRRLPVHAYHSHSPARHGADGNEDVASCARPNAGARASSRVSAGHDGPVTDCAICLMPFQDEERIKTLPCLHQFHAVCIDPWLRTNAVCPVCKFPALAVDDVQLESMV